MTPTSTICLDQLRLNTLQICKHLEDELPKTVSVLNFEGQVKSTDKDFQMNMGMVMFPKIIGNFWT